MHQGRREAPFLLADRLPMGCSALTLTAMNDDDDNDRTVILAKRAGRILGYLFVIYLIWSLGQLAKLW